MNDAQKNILVIEDEPSLIEAIKLKLEKAGTGVWTAGSGEEGLAVLRTKTPDLLWLDILLPGMDGMEVLRRIRANPLIAKLKTMVVSASSGPEKVKEIFKMGALDYVIKSEHSLDEIIKRAKSLL